MDDIPAHFHKEDRISEADIIPDGNILSVIPSYAAPEGTEVTYKNGTTIRRYKMIDGVWQYMPLSPLDVNDIPNLDAGKIVSGVLSTARLGSGSADSTKFLRGDQTWAVPPAIYEQLVPAPQDTTSTFLPKGVTSDQTPADVFWGISCGPSVAMVIARYAKDPNTGKYYKTHQVNSADSLAANGDQMIPGLAIVGSYLYVAYVTSGVFKFKRFDKADLTNETAITISGTSPGTGGAGKYPMYSNGTDLYVYAHNATTDWYRFTISGTTVTNAQTLTITNTAEIGAWCDGTNVYMLRSGNFGKTVLKCLVDGSSQTTTDFDLGKTVYNKIGSDFGGGVFGFNSSVVYIAYGCQFDSQSAFWGHSYLLEPFTKP